jgi:hypothetical protein
MKKHYSKRKKVVIDAVDGKIINEPIAIKISNVEEFVEKNGFKIIKILSLLIIVFSFMNNVYAFDETYLTQLDLSTAPNVYLLIAILLFALIFILFGIVKNAFMFLLIGCLILLFIGLILLINGFNVVLSMLISLTALLLIWLGA